MSDLTELTRLRQEVHASRQEALSEYQGLLHELDFRSRFKESVKRHPFGWLGGAAAAGLVATLFGFGGKGSRKKPSVTPTPISPSPSPTPSLARIGWIAGAVEIGKFLYPLLKPIVMPVVVDFLGRTARSGLVKRARSR
jgi:hypothetical protein